MKEMICPNCGSTNTYFSKKKIVWVCEDCETSFSDDSKTSLKLKWNQKLLNDEYWEYSLISVAPISLSISYQQLRNYVAEGNIGCTLFLVRDVFELMIKTPVVILFDGLYSILEHTEDKEEFLCKHPKFKALYTNSMQILTTGKWWECVRIGADLKIEFRDEGLFTDRADFAYRETVEYLQIIYKMFWFQVPGQARTNMVSWRNRAVGHSCFANNPEENYREIPYILKMFKKVGAVSVSYYRKVSFADNNKYILNGSMISPPVGEQVYIAYIGRDNYIFTKMHSFVAGKSENLAYYDGYQKGKAYLLNYADGNRYSDNKLSEYLDSMNKSGNKVILSSSSIEDGNLETADINQLEKELNNVERIVNIPFLYEWLMKQTEDHDKGVFLLQAERGMGKSMFCDTLNQLSSSENVLRFSEDIVGWTEFMENSAIRVWHFNSTYNGRRDIYVAGIASAMLTISNGYFENQSWIEANRFVGKLESLWNNLIKCEEELRHVYFAEAINATADEFFLKTEKNRIILVLDGIDEVTDIKSLLSYIPDASELNPNVYILLVTRTDSELGQSNDVRTLFNEKTITVTLEFLRNQITSYENGMIIDRTSDNKFYQNAIVDYVDNVFSENTKNQKQKIIEQFGFRFSEISAYKKLCKINPIFEKIEATDLMSAFIDVLMQNAPEAYCHRVEKILNVLAWSGSSLTIRELAYLCGEQYVSYSFIGMLYDLRAFIKVVRTGRGSCYEFAHGEWEESVKEKYRFGDVLFRCFCNQLLSEFEKERHEDIFSEEYQGELWLISNYLKMYNQAWDMLKENWFERIEIDTIEKIWCEIIERIEDISDLENVTSKKSISLLKRISQLWEDYDTAVRIFNSTEYKGLQCSVSKSTKSSLARSLVLELIDRFSVNKMLRLFNNGSNPIDVATVFENIGKVYSKMSIRCKEDGDILADTLAMLAVECYQNAACIYSSEKDNSFIRDVIENIYQSGALCQIIGWNEDARKHFEAAFQLVLRAKDAFGNDSRVEFLAAKVCTRYGKMLTDVKEKYDYYISAERFLNALVDRSPEVVIYLSWRTWLFRLMAKWNEERADNNTALSYWEKATDDAEYIYKVRGRESDRVDLIKALRGLSDIYINTQHYSEAVPLLKRLLQFEGTKLTYLRNLSKVLGDLNLLQEKADIDKHLKPLEEKEFEYANAYKEVLEILEFTTEEYVAKIPDSLVELFKTRANSDHIFHYNPDIPLNQQNISKKAREILAVIYRDYWTSDLQKVKFKMHDERKQIKRRVNLLNEVINQRCDYNEGTAMSVLEQNHNSAFFNEVDLILQNIPEVIVSFIPISILLYIVKKKVNKYEKEFDQSGGNDYYPESILIIKYLIKQYVPDSLIQEVNESVSEG